VEVLDLLTDLNRRSGTTIAMVLHDLNLAARYADRLVAVHDGKVYGQGAPEDVLTQQTVADVFGLQSQVIPDPVSGKPLVVPVGRHHSGSE
jgi:iron complex transport system ATP-binding protein